MTIGSNFDHHRDNLLIAESFRDELRKCAVLGTILGAGAASHLGVNAALKNLEHIPPEAAATTWLAKLRRKAAISLHDKKNQMAATGIQRGMSGAPESLGSHFARAFVGPEIPAMQDATMPIGKGLATAPVSRQYRLLKKMRLEAARNPVLAGTEGGSALIGGINHMLRPTRTAVSYGTTAAPAAQALPRVNSVHPTAAGNFMRRALPVATGAVAGLAEPGLWGHVGTNLARNRIAQSALGRRVLTKDINQGVRAAIGQGPVRPGWQQTAIDYAVSPAFSAPRRTAAALAQQAHQGFQGLAPGVASLPRSTRVAAGWMLSPQMSPISAPVTNALQHAVRTTPTTINDALAKARTLKARLRPAP